MRRTIEFYFDYLSPYAYLAWLCLPQICDRRDVGIVPRPVLFAGLLNHWGQLGPAEIPPKGRHVFKECARFAALRAIPFRMPLYHPFRPLTALRVSLAAQAGAEQAAVITAIFKCGWADGGDLGDDQVICDALSEAGLDAAALMQHAQTTDVKQRLRTETEAATELGVFGVPTMRIDEELFWGLDQLQYIAMYLDDDDPYDRVDPSALQTRGRGAVRPGSVSTDKPAST